MRIKEQLGQAFILVLILLAIGAIIIIPLLNLTNSSVKNSQIFTERSRQFYAADAAQEYVMWKLLYTGYTSNFTYDGEEDAFSIDICGIPVNVSVVMRAMATWRGVTLIGNTPIKPTITVSPSLVSPPGNTTYTYTITLEQISGNSTTELNALYFILPSGFNTSSYVMNSTQISVDNGTWQQFGNPLKENSQSWPTGGPSFGGQVRLRWPDPNDATYSDGPTTGNFTSPTKTFNSGQIKQIQFQVTGNLAKNNNGDYYYYSWVVLKPWNTLSGATAAIDIRDGTTAGAKYDNGLIDSYKSTNKAFIPPGQLTDVTYTITVRNLQGSSDQLLTVTDYLPPGFTFVDDTANGLGFTNGNPSSRTYGDVNGIERWTLVWDIPTSAKSIASGQTKTMSFMAQTSENVSGSYYNEVNVVSNNGIPQIFSSPGVSVTQQNFATAYTWNSAAVIVPAYDSSTTAGNVTTNANLSVTVGSVAISSYQVK